MRRVSTFVTVKDAILCARVCKDWAEVFVPIIWFEVDFMVHHDFDNLSSDILSKYGHLIRIVKLAKLLPSITLLANMSVNQLRELHIEATAAIIQHVLMHEIITRNISSLKEVSFLAITVDGELDSLAQSVSALALVPFSGRSASPPKSVARSSLTVLNISGLCLTYDVLMATLRGCPLLSDLTMHYTELFGVRPLSFQHARIKAFAASIDIIFPADNDDEDEGDDDSSEPSLLCCFPNLRYLGTWNDTERPIQTARIKKELARRCPHITVYGLNDGTRKIASHFCTRICRNLTEVGFNYDHITAEVIAAILLHQSSLVRVMANHIMFPSYEDDAVEEARDHFQESRPYLQLIPRSCRMLRELEIHPHEMDMDDVEMDEWVCKDLESLSVRVKGLDTKEKILKVIALWRKGCWRRWQEQAGTPVREEGIFEVTDMSIEARVARHLLKFDKLWWVWLGYQTWTPL
ncbi:hypothetical protein EC991_009242 [Linnemannia zychae]|nr:hypothetical protein EC991_009242 [Linnemannia zychae]